MEAAKELPACPVETTLMLISDKWKVLILRDLMPGTRRFGELKKSIGTVSQKVLTAQLRDMEAKGLVDIRKEDFPHRYRAAVSREDCAAAERRGLLERAYQGSAGKLVAAFLKDEKLTPQERDELRKLLDEMEV